jgi:hypothetical protein
MAKVKAYVWIKTNKIGSMCVAEIEVEEDETDVATLEEIGQDVIWNMAEWGVSLEPPSSR